MPKHGRLYPLVTNEQKDLYYFLREAQRIADEHGDLNGAIDFTDTALENKMRAMHFFDDIMFARDAKARQGVVKILTDVIYDAISLNYNAADDDMFKALVRVAVAMHSSNYTPMRVLGATAEGIKIIPK